MVSTIDLAIFISRVESICAEMGAILRRAAFSPNIKDRLDFSCALFDAKGQLFAQAAHIPVHLGSMAFAMKEIVKDVCWQPGDMLVLNDPFKGGTHLPDVTIIAPCFDKADSEKLIGFVVNRAHHANIGSEVPGSMPLSRSIKDEGVIIEPSFIIKGGKLDEKVLNFITGESESDLMGDFAAQMSANRTGVSRLNALYDLLGGIAFDASIEAANQYGLRLSQNLIKEIPNGQYCFEDYMDDDGFGNEDIKISVCLLVKDEEVTVDFTGTAEQVEGNINCPLSVAAAAVYYAFRCLLPKETPNCAGSFQPIGITAPLSCLVNAQYPAATSAGNVETSMRIVDVILGALNKAIPRRIPAASQGTMNNVAMGARNAKQSWDYYETIGGGMGAGAIGPGLSSRQCHMTNTLNTPIESVESHYPLRVREYAIRRNVGGDGLYPGGDGIVREFEFLEPAEFTLLSERRKYPPWGLAGGDAASVGINSLDGKPIPGKCHRKVESGQVLRIETPGGGGYGKK
ncbi:MAG: N-methylhydantoinase B [Candidatus Azotimanducaceae bacterium]|jgi:N-methylhydantoinase B